MIMANETSVANVKESEFRFWVATWNVRNLTNPMSRRVKLDFMANAVEDVKIPACGAHNEDVSAHRPDRPISFY